MERILGVVVLPRMVMVMLNTPAAAELAPLVAVAVVQDLEEMVPTVL